MSFGCNELYVYGNAVKIMADSPKFTLSLCEVEVYADTYGKIETSSYIYIVHFGDFLVQNMIKRIKDKRVNSDFSF